MPISCLACSCCRVSSGGGGGKLSPQNLGQLYRKVYKATPISWSFPPQNDSLWMKPCVGDIKIYKTKVLGSGIFGCVFEGIYKGNACAVKVLHEVGMEITLNLTKGGAVQEARLSSFEKECKNLFDLKHPNIVELLHVCPYPP